MARTKTCGGCRQKYRVEPGQPPFRNWCGTDCAVTIARARQDRTRARAQAKAEKAHRAENRARRVALKTRAQHLNDAQTAVNAYVRARDYGKPCVSCGKPDDGSHQRHASHYRSVKAASCLRFNLRNIFSSCAQCNTMKSGNLLEYRLNLVNARGHDYVDWLECQNYTVRYDIDYLKRMKRIFSRRARYYRRRRGI